MAVKIVEDGQPILSRLKPNSKGASHLDKGVKEGLHKGLQIQKTLASKVARSNVVEWVKNTQAQVDLIGKSVAFKGCGSSSTADIPKMNDDTTKESLLIDEMSDDGDRSREGDGGNL
ncbi:hypothetical protein V6N11_001546 [Hibiscus sabdariffa]|uniref:Uncharacterized protein n=1 Tax=Hibiscus sabdariffa TaxID=183260 RepID=A0ABR2S0F6_9ROSI